MVRLSPQMYNDLPINHPRSATLNSLVFRLVCILFPWIIRNENRVSKGFKPLEDVTMEDIEERIAREQLARLVKGTKPYFLKSDDFGSKYVA